MRASSLRGPTLRTVLRGSLAAVTLAAASCALTACGAGPAAAPAASRDDVRGPARGG